MDTMKWIPRMNRDVLSLFTQDERICRVITKEMKERILESKVSILTAGCFDLKHRGHDMSLFHTRMYAAQRLAFMEGVKEWKDLSQNEKKKWMQDERITIIVAIASDAFIQRVKGRERPLSCWKDRASSVGQIGWRNKEGDYHPVVDWIIEYGTDQKHKEQTNIGELALELKVKELVVCEEYIEYAKILEERYQLDKNGIQVSITERFRIVNPISCKEYSTTECIQRASL